MLSRREHSAEELRSKLLTKARTSDWLDDTDEAEVAELISQLQQEGLQSDQRFAESYTHMRYNKGYGPVRIDNELRERGVSENIRYSCLHDSGRDAEHDWSALIVRVREKKFGRSIPDDYAERAKQMRFLQYRGFTSEKIRELF